jgi:hypothetical protein
MKRNTMMIDRSTPDVGGSDGGVYAGDEKTKRDDWSDRATRTKN